MYGSAVPVIQVELYTPTSKLEIELFVNIMVIHHIHGVEYIIALLFRQNSHGIKQFFKAILPWDCVKGLCNLHFIEFSTATYMIFYIVKRAKVSNPS